MLRKDDKAKIVDGLADKLKRQHMAVFSDFHGVSVANAEKLRRLLRTVDGEYKVAKKTLLQLALKQAGIEMNVKDLKGEIGVAFGYGDEVAPAKIMVKFGKTNETFKILGGLLHQRMLKDKDIISLSKMPPREVLLAQLLGALQSPIRGLATALGANMRNLVVVLNKVATRNR